MRIIKEDVDSSNFLMLEASTGILASGPNAVAVTRDKGVFVNGALSISSSVDNLKFAGMFRINPIAASGLPSTMVTPIPMFIMETPIRGISTMSAIGSIFASLA